MKMNKFFIYLMALAALFFTACEKDPIDPDDPIADETSALLILSEGSWGGNNSKLAHYNLETGALDTDYFNTVNQRGLGDTANDMLLYGSKVYIVVNVSSTLEIIDAKTGKSLRQISMKNDDNTSKEPRKVVGHNGKVYVTSYDDTVVKIDTTTYEIEATLSVGMDPEGMCVVNDKLYVANSGGLSGYDNTISVVNLTTFKEESKIEVAINPVNIGSDSKGNVYVASHGNYFDVMPSFQRINATSGTVEILNEIPSPDKFVISDDKAYIISGSYGNPYTLIVYDCKNDKVISENFITDGTELGIIHNISIDTVSGDVFLMETDYVVPGNVYCFDKDGKLKYSLTGVGINPTVVEFVK